MTHGRNRNTLWLKRPKLLVLVATAIMGVFILTACAADLESKESADDAKESPLVSIGVDSAGEVSDEIQYSTAAAVGDAMYSLFDSGVSMDVGLWISRDGDYNTYMTDSRWYAERFVVLISDYTWSETNMPGTTPSDFRITVSSADGSAAFTFWQGGDAETVQYTSDGETQYWLVTPAGLAEAIRNEYDNLDIDSSRIAFEETGTAEDVAEVFVKDIYADLRLGLAPGGMYSITDYKVVNWGVGEVNDDQTAILGWFDYAVIPEDYNSIGIWAGNTVEGTGDYEGWLVMSREFVLQKQSDGHWHCIGLGTGGYGLPED